MTDQSLRRSNLRDRRLHLSALLLPILLATACTVTLVSSYDEHIDEAATTLQREMDAFLTSVERAGDDPAGAFDANAGFYDQYLVDLRAVEVRAAAHQNNDITLQQIALMRQSVEDLRALHEEQGRIGPAAADSFRELFNTAWRAIIQWEIAKKRGAG